MEIQWLIGTEILEVKVLGHEYTKSDTQLHVENFVKLLPVPFTIEKILQRGKEIGIFTSKGAIMLRSMGQGSYVYGLKELKYLDNEPFKSDGNLVFCGSNKALVLVDCRSFRHQLVLEFVWPSVTQKTITQFFTTEKETPKIKESDFWSPKRGPCVVTQQLQFEENFVLQLKNNRSYFEKHSIAYVMFDQLLCNGLGHYTVAEILNHLYIDFGSSHGILHGLHSLNMTVL